VGHRWELGVVCRQGDQSNPAGSPLLDEGQPDVLGDHLRVAAVMLAVLGW